MKKAITKNGLTNTVDRNNMAKKSMVLFEIEYAASQLTVEEIIDYTTHIGYFLD
jgi:hypothetical protein